MSQWYSVKESLPKPFVDVLLYSPGAHKNFACGWWDEQDKAWRPYNARVHRPTHWMPLPGSPTDYNVIPPKIAEAAKAALAHVEELEDAWMRGVIDERDDKGGTRSNRNVAVRVALHAALKGSDTRTERDSTP